MAKAVSFLSLSGIRGVGLGGHQDGGLGGERRVKGLQFGGDRFEVGDRVGACISFHRVAGVGDVDQVDDDRGALDVFEELDAQAVAEVCAFDQARQIGYGEGEFVGEVADLDYAEVGFERGEGVVGDLGARRGDARDQCGLANIGVTDEAGISQQAELEAIVALLSCASRVHALAEPGWVRSVAKC